MIAYNAILLAMLLQSPHTHNGYWKCMHTPMERRIVARYLNAPNIKPNAFIDTYNVLNIPVAAIVAQDFTTRGIPIVEEVYLNKGMLILVNCTDLMRSTLKMRYKGINTKDPVFTCMNEFP